MYQESNLEPHTSHENDVAKFQCVLNFTSRTLPDHDQFEAFKSTYQGVMDISSIEGQPLAFPASQTVWDLGRLAFTRTTLPGKGHAHRRRHLNKNALDHWYISLMHHSSTPDCWQHDTTVPRLNCLAKSMDVEVDDDGIIMLFIPHELLISTDALDGMSNTQLEGGLGKLLADYLFLLDRSMSHLLTEEIPYVVEATRSLVAVCLAPSRDRFVEAQAPIDSTLLARARRFINGKLADPTLTSDVLCVALGVSRSRLYRLFEPFGGVASYIRRQRFIKVRDALSDCEDSRSISRIAEEWGFLDASAFSRAFRHEFGISPKEARDIGWASNGFVVTRGKMVEPGNPQTLGQVLCRLSA